MLIAGFLTTLLLMTIVWIVVSQLRHGAHGSSTLVGLGRLQTLATQIEHDARDARPRGDVPLLLDEAVLRAIGFPGGRSQLAEMPHPIELIPTAQPDGVDRTVIWWKRWRETPRGWTHNDRPDEFNRADDDLEPRGVPELERVAARWFPQLEETFVVVSWPRDAAPQRVFLFIFRRQGWAIYTEYRVDAGDRTAGTVTRWTAEQGPRVIADGGVEAVEALPCFEFAAHPGDPARGMEMTKCALVIRVLVREPDPGNAIAPIFQDLGRRIYPEWLNVTPWRTQWPGP